MLLLQFGSFCWVVPVTAQPQTGTGTARLSDGETTMLKVEA